MTPSRCGPIPYVSRIVRVFKNGFNRNLYQNLEASNYRRFVVTCCVVVKIGLYHTIRMRDPVLMKLPRTILFFIGTPTAGKKRPPVQSTPPVTTTVQVSSEHVLKIT